jgi:hypothetical protein
LRQSIFLFRRRARAALLIARANVEPTARNPYATPSAAVADIDVSAGQTAMNWKRIGVFVAATFAATFMVGIPWGFAQGFYKARGVALPAWFGYGQAASAFVTNVAVLVVLAKRQSEKPWRHTWMVILIGWILALPLNVGLFGQPLVAWALTVVPLCISVVIAVPIGRLLRRKWP